MNEADMRAPALVTRDLFCFRCSRRGFPEDVELHVDLTQITNGLTHLAGPNTAVEVDYRGCFPGSTRHAPLAMPFKVCELGPVMKRQRSHVDHALEPADDRISVLDQPFCITLLDVRNLRVKLPELLSRHLLETRLFGIASNQIEIVAVNDSLGEYPFGKRVNLIDVVASEHAVDVHFKTPAEHRLQSAKHSSALDSLLEVAGNSAHSVVIVLQSIQRDVDVQFEIRIAFQAMLGDFVDAPRLQSVCRKVDMADAVLRHEKIDNIFQVAAKRRFTAAEPQVRQLRHALGEPDDFLPVEIARAIQFIPIETGVARGVAVGGDEEDQRVQLAASPRYTSV